MGMGEYFLEGVPKGVHPLYKVSQWENPGDYPQIEKSGKALSKMVNLGLQPKTIIKGQS
jgi:hypothetical protein